MEAAGKANDPLRRVAQDSPVFVKNIGVLGP